MAGNPNFPAASRGNRDLEHALQTMHDRLERLERGLQVQGVDPDRQSKVGNIPPRAGLKVVAADSGGRMTVHITNPEFLIRKGQNPLRTPIYHKVRYSTDPTFRSGVTELPPSTQTHWPIDVTPGAAVHVEVTHSYDGHNWSLPVRSDAVNV